jgi:sigma-B regulation protein RsbU (phosphoserine phosphatase)
MDKPLHLLIVEDSQADAELLVRELRVNGYDVSYQRVETRQAMAAALQHGHWDAVIADYSMPSFDALQAMELVKQQGSGLPFIIVSGTITDEMAVAGMKAGARDYVMKDNKDNLSRLAPAVDRELRAAMLEHKWERSAQQLRAASAIQRTLFPDGDAVVPGFDLAGAVFPAEETTGDYYDFIPTPDGRLGIALGDVMGHGVGSAILMAEIRAWLRALTVSHTDVGEVLTHVNVLFVDGAPEGAFVTLFLARLDPVTRTLTHASAGHRGYVIAPCGSVRSYLDSSGLPLGVRPDSEIPTLSEIQLYPGDVVLLATDGFFEAVSPDGAIFGVDGVLDAVRRCRPAPAREIVRNLYDEVRAFVNQTPQQDDMAAVVLKTLPTASVGSTVA